MASYHCPSCTLPVRGLSMFQALRAGSGLLAPKATLRCPRCSVQLAYQLNRWQFTGQLAAISGMLSLNVFSGAEFPVLHMSLRIFTLAGFLVMAIGVAYFPRYRIAD